jgi:hypothetical protein
VTPYTFIQDDFLEQFAELRAYADKALFTDVSSPVDGVTYPFICRDIQLNIRHEIEFQLAATLGASVAINHLFMRLSPAGVPVPHEAHTDLSMGQWSLMLYLNREFHCRGGTSLIRHKRTGLSVHPRNDAELGVWQEDHNQRNAWDIDLLVPMRANRAFIFPSYLMHRAEPIGGFGIDQINGRLVLTAFFNLR